MARVPIPPKPRGLKPYIIEYLIDDHGREDGCGTYRDTLLAASDTDAAERFLERNNGISTWHQKNKKGEGKISVIYAYPLDLSHLREK